MRIPLTAQNRLHREFDGRYRFRWSEKKQEVHLEQRVGHGAADLPFRLDEWDDSLVRAKDGYALVMAIRPGTTMPCPTCGRELQVPVLETRETVCEHCKLEGLDGRVMAAYYPLDGEILFDHIRHIDYYLGHNVDIIEEQNDNNQRLLQTQTNATLNEIDAISYDLRKTLGGIEQVGYGKSIIRPVGD